VNATIADLRMLAQVCRLWLLPPPTLTLPCICSRGGVSRADALALGVQLNEIRPYFLAVHVREYASADTVGECDPDLQSFSLYTYSLSHVAFTSCAGDCPMAAGVGDLPGLGKRLSCPSGGQLPAAPGTGAHLSRALWVTIDPRSKEGGRGRGRGLDK
jgi:hypothetical protein